MKRLFTRKLSYLTFILLTFVLTPDWLKIDLINRMPINQIGISLQGKYLLGKLGSAIREDTWRMMDGLIATQVFFTNKRKKK